MALNLTKLQKHELFTCYSSYQWLSPWVAVCMHSVGQPLGGRLHAR